LQNAHWIKEMTILGNEIGKPMAEHLDIEGVEASSQDFD